MYDAVGGHETLLRLAGAWHTRVVADEVVGHAFRHGVHPQHTERLAAYWAESLGGPTTYSDHHGDETSLVRLHSGNGVHEEMDRNVLSALGRKDADALKATPRERLYSAASETLNWIAVLPPLNGATFVIPTARTPGMRAIRSTASAWKAGI